MAIHPLNAPPRRIAEGVHMVGGPDLSDPRDCLCYLVQGPEARVLIDCGAGPSAARILELVGQAGGQPPTHLLITHAHIDHAGGAAGVRRLSGCQIIIHQDDAPTLAQGDPLRSAAQWYGLKLEPAQADLVLGQEHSLDLGGGQALNILHTPGHTPGSLSAWCQAEGQRVLFGQDIHGPFSPSFGSDLGLWRESMQALLALNCDILAEGHYGVFRPAQEVAAFINKQLGMH
ncbi:MAG: MBL fold metallo-hydrolase [Desulfarculus sp.]|nr:MBL fold metallo-hydrolase [Desulfarculus sp.]